MQARFAAPIAALFASSLAARAQAPLYTVAGETFDQVGRAVAFLPDVDNDGVEDFVVGAPYDDPALTGEQLGSVALYSGKTGAKLRTFVGEHDGCEFGRSLAGVPDVDGDGYWDVLVGSPSYSVALSEQGAAYVLGSNDGLVHRKYVGASAHEFFGTSVANLGDVDFDGTNDYAVGAPYADVAGFVDSGRVTVYSGATSLVLHDWSQAAGNALFGMSLATAGDVDGDGRADYLVGAPTLSYAGVNACGAAFLFTGGIAATSVFAGSESGEHFGWSLASLGDVEDDKNGEFAIGAPYYNGAGSSRGRVRVFDLNGLRYEITGQDGWRLGFALAAAGDLNGDGVQDFAIGAPGHAAPGGDEHGAVRIHACINGGIVTTLQGFDSESYFGTALDGERDLNGDGYGELLVGAAGDNAQAGEGGSARLLLADTQKPYVYGSAKTDSEGCTPAIGFSGAASMTLGDNFHVSASGVASGVTGMLFWSYTSANTPFHGGKKLVGNPLARTLAQSSGQALDACGGSFDFHFSHAYMAANGVTAGIYLHAQYWYRDAGFAAPNNLGLTDALRFEIAH